MKDIGIAGLPYSGKTTLFQALTLSGSTGGRSNQAVVDVADPRLEVLARLEHSKEIVPAKVRFVDVPGGLTARGIAEYRQTDALCIVLRAFGGDADPLRELASVQDELLLADLASLEGGRDRAAKRARGSPEAKTEFDVLDRAHGVVDSGLALRAAELDEAALKLLRGYGLLTLKPQVIVSNVEEGAAPPEGLKDAIAISAALEAEVAGMAAAEALELLQGFGVAERGLDRVITSSYRALDLVTFLTTGEDESRAWEVRRGATAPEAAGQIHSDLERGFIRAEVVAYDDLVAAGSWAKCKEKGVLRVEGKDYLVKEGDVINVRFAV